MNYIIKEIEKKDLYDYMYVFTHAWDETYRGIMANDFLDKIKNELDKNVEHLKNKFDKTKKVKPYGVDVNSGCKNDKGTKDKKKVEKFVYNAKNTII